MKTKKTRSLNSLKKTSSIQSQNVSTRLIIGVFVLRIVLCIYIYCNLMMNITYTCTIRLYHVSFPNQKLSTFTLRKINKSNNTKYLSIIVRNYVKYACILLFYESDKIWIHNMYLNFRHIMSFLCSISVFYVDICDFFPRPSMLAASFIRYGLKKVLKNAFPSEAK